MANWGIGLGGLALGFEKGVKLGNELYKQGKERDQDEAYEGAVNEGKANFDAAVAAGTEKADDYPASLRYAAGPIMKAAMETKDLPRLEYFSKWKDSDEAKTGAKLFESGMRRTTLGDVQGGWSDFQKLGRLKGYGGDYEIGELSQTTGGGFQTTIKKGDGSTVVKQFANGEELASFMAKVGNPAVAFEDLRNNQKRKEVLADDKTKYETHAGIDVDKEKNLVPIQVDKTRQTAKVTSDQKRADAPIETEEEVKRQTALTPAAMERYAAQKRADLQHAQEMDQAGLGPPRYEVVNRAETDENGKPVTRTYGVNRTNLDARRVFQDDGGVSKPGTGSGAGAGGKPYSWERMAEAFEAQGYSKAEALERATGRRPSSELDIQKTAATILNSMEPKPSYMSPKQKEAREAKLKEITDNIRKSVTQDRTSNAPGITGPQPGASTAPAVPAKERPEQMSPGNGQSPVAATMPQRPSTVPPGAGYSPGTGMWFTRDGKKFDKNGNPVE